MVQSLIYDWSKQFGSDFMPVLEQPAAAMVSSDLLHMPSTSASSVQRSRFGGALDDPETWGSKGPLPSHPKAKTPGKIVFSTGNYDAYL